MEVSSLCELAKLYKSISQNDICDIVMDSMKFTKDDYLEKSPINYTISDYKGLDLSTFDDLLALDCRIDLINIMPHLEAIFDNVKSIIVTKGLTTILRINSYDDKNNYVIIDLELVRSKLVKKNTKYYSFSPYLVVAAFVIGLVVGKYSRI